MLFDQIRSNHRKTDGIMVIFFLIVTFFGGVIGYFTGDVVKACLITLLIAAVYVFIMMHQSVNVVLAMNHGVEVTRREQEPVLWDAVGNMAIAANLPMPRVFIIEDSSPNALSIGTKPDNSAIGATTGLLRSMDKYEIEGVVGHEMSHIKDHDTQVETVGIALMAIFSFIGGFVWRLIWYESWFDWGDDDNDNDRDSQGAMIAIGIALALFSWLCFALSYLTQMALSRNREYLADAGSVDLTRNPDEIIRALKSLEQRPAMKAANPASNSLFIVNPNKPQHHWSISNLFDDHPPLQDRIERLEEM